MIEILFDEVPEFNTGDMVVIATNEEMAMLCKERNIPVIGLEEGQNRIWSAKYIVTDRKDVDEEFAKMVLARHKGEAYSPFETERLIAIEIDMSSREEAYEFLNGLGGGVDIDKGFLEQEEYLRTYIDNQYQFYGFGMYRLIDKATGEFVGMTSLNLERGEVFTMGYAIKEDKRRMGLAYEACLGTLEFAKGLGYDQIFLKIARSNEPSIKLAKKLGFESLNDDFENEGLVCIFYKNLI